MVYDYVITKPPLDQDTLMHYGVKGMKWHVSKLKNKVLEAKTKRNRKKRKMSATDVSRHNGKVTLSGPHTKFARSYYKTDEVPISSAGSYNKSNRDILGFTGATKAPIGRMKGKERAELSKAGLEKIYDVKNDDYYYRKKRY